MVFNQTQNASIKNNLIDELKLNPAVDTIPNVVNPTIQPVFEVKKKVSNFLKAASRTTTGTSTLVTTSSSVDTYITAASLSLTKDATCDQASGAISLTCIVGGTTLALCRLSTITLTAQDKSIAMAFDPPIKLDRNTAVTIPLSFTAGAESCSGTIYGYEEETAIKTV